MEEIDFEKLSDADKALLMENVKKAEDKDRKEKLNFSREKELKNLTINNISCTEKNLFRMVVKHNVLPDSEKATWIDIDDNEVEMTKDELGQLIYQGAASFEDVFFHYRKFKDEIK